MSKLRMQKINSELQKNIYEILSQKVRNPNLTEMFSIMEVQTDNDLATAKVYVSVFSTDEKRKEATLNAISDSAGFVRSNLAKMMSIRTVPSLNFIEDKTMGNAQRIEEILRGKESK